MTVSEIPGDVGFDFCARLRITPGETEFTSDMEWDAQQGWLPWREASQTMNSVSLIFAA